MDQMIVSLLFVIIDLYIVILFIRMFLSSSERYDALFGMIYRATDWILNPLGPTLRTRQVDLAPLIVILLLLVFEGMLAGSIPLALQQFADRLFQLYVLIIIIIAGFREYYTNPIASFGQRLVNPVRAVAANFSRQVVTVNLLSVVLLLLLHIIVSLVLVHFIGNPPENLVQIMVIRSLLKIVDITIFFTYVIIINVILSWLSPDPLNPVVQLITLISAPIVDPIRRYVPPIGGMFDISPIIAIFALQVVHDLGYRLLSSV